LESGFAVVPPAAAALENWIAVEEKKGKKGRKVLAFMMICGE